MKHWICQVLLLVPLVASASSFSDARAAADRGHYQDVVAFLSKAIANHQLGADQLGTAYANRGVAWSLLGRYGKARRDLHRALKLDPADNLALNQLGMLAEKVDHDDGRAANWYRKASEAGYAPAEANLARLYLHGEGVIRDAGRALALYQLAVDQRYTPAYTPLGVIYFEGIGRPKYPRLAITLFNQGAAAGDVAAHYYLGLAWRRGEGVAKNTGRAVEEFRIAAAKDNGPAEAALGDMYRLGEGVSMDISEAARWYRLAAGRGVVSAADALARLLATCPTQTLCDGDDALTLAQAVTREHPTPHFMDTLAASYARVGEFDLAVRTMDKIIAAVPATSQGYRVYVAHRDRYKHGQVLQY